MSTFAILAIAWIPVAVAIIIGFGFFLGWLDDRAEKRRVARGNGAGRGGT